MTTPELERPVPAWRRRLHTIIFEADTPAGKAFDFGVLCCIMLSVLAVMLESVTRLRTQYGALLHATSGPSPCCLPSSTCSAC